MTEIRRDQSDNINGEPEDPLPAAESSEALEQRLPDDRLQALGSLSASSVQVEAVRATMADSVPTEPAPQRRGHRSNREKGEKSSRVKRSLPIAARMYLAQMSYEARAERRRLRRSSSSRATS